MDFEINWNVTVVVVLLLIIGVAGFLAGQQFDKKTSSTQLKYRVQSCEQNKSILVYEMNGTQYDSRCLRVAKDIKGYTYLVAR